MSTNLELFPNSSFIAQINEEHQELDTLLDKLSVCHLTPAARINLDQIQSLWTKHSKTEFLHMRQHNYVSIANHALDHVAIADAFRKLQAELHQPTYSLKLENWPAKMEALKSLLLWHFDLHDSEYAKFKTQQNSENEPQLQIWY